VSILIDGIIFDLDGTLWDSTHTGAKYWTQAAQNEGVDATITSEQLKGLYGLPTELIAAKLFPKESETKRIQIMSESTKLQNKVLVEKGGILYPSVKEVLYRIKETYPLYIVSNCLEGYIQAFIKAHQLEGVFEDFEYPGRTKLPKADNIQMLMERNNIKNTFYIVDTLGDQEAAKKAGITFVYASYGFGNSEVYDYIIKDFKEIEHLPMLNK